MKTNIKTAVDLFIMKRVQTNLFYLEVFFLDPKQENGRISIHERSVAKKEVSENQWCPISDKTPAKHTTESR